MSLAQWMLFIFLLVIGIVTLGVHFNGDNLVVGISAIAAALLMVLPVRS